MAKRDIPDFDAMAAFDKALAQQKPDLAARLGVTEPVQSDPPAAPEEKREPILKVVTAPVVDAPQERKVKPRAVAKPATKRRGVVARANGKELRRLTVYVELAVAQRLRKYCFEHELNLSDVAAQALEAGLQRMIDS